MTESLAQPKLETRPLTRELAAQYLDSLNTLANQIPEVDYSPKDIVAEQKGESKLYNKWDHSLVVFDNDTPVAFVMGYERQGEGNEQYPWNTLYISELAVAESHQQQGIARKLLKHFFEKNNLTGFLTLEGELNYSIQTNSAEWNDQVVGLYKSFGFQQRAIKDYPNRTDLILGVNANELNLG